MSIQYYLRILGARSKLILTVTIVAFVGSILLALVWPSQYESSVRIHVQPLPAPPNESTGLYYSQGYYRQLIAQYNIEDFSEIVQGQEFAARIAAIVAEQFGLNLTPKLITESLHSDDNHRILELTYSSSEPEVAQALAFAAQTIFESSAGDYSAMVRQGIVGVRIVDPASDPEATSFVRLGLDIVARTFVAFLLITGIAFVVEILSGLCRSRDDVAEAVGVPILTSIPPIPPHTQAAVHDAPTSQ
jgi:capsular polysaccharide biosynthesis protein